MHGSRVPAPPDRLPTIGITGTNGKTTTATWTAFALSARAPTVRATTLGYFLDDARLDFPPTYDGFVGAVREARRRGARHAVLELTSEALARGIARAWPADVAVFTNLTHDHLDAHGSPEHYLASKAQLFLSLREGGTAILNGCDLASSLLAETLPSGVRVRRYGVPSRGPALGALDLWATEVDVSWSGTRVAIASSSESGLRCSELRVRGIGEVYAENALAALLACVAAGLDPDGVAAALALAEPPPGRFEVVSRSPFVVVDYAHSPDALTRVVATARTLCSGQLHLVFGAGGNRDSEKRPFMGRAAADADHIVLTSDNPRTEDAAAIAMAIREGLELHRSVLVELDRARAIASAIARARPTDVILVAGKGHENEQIVGLTTRQHSDRDVALAALGRRAGSAPRSGASSKTGRP